MSDPAREFIVNLFTELDRQGIEYVIARRAHFLPEQPPGRDIDVIYRLGMLGKVMDVVSELTDLHRGTLVTADRLLGHAQVVIVFGASGSTARIARLDFQSSISYRGLELVSNRAMLHGRKREGLYWRPRPEIEAVALLLHDLVEKSGFRRGDIDEIRDFRRQAPAEFRSVLEQSAGAPRALSLDRALEAGDADALLSQRRGVIAACAVRSYGRIIWWHARHGIRLLSFALRRRGALAVVVGPDGSGKSTLIESALERLRSYGYKSERIYFGTTSPILPTRRLMRWFYHGRRQQINQMNRPVRDGETLKTKVFSLLGSCHTLLDQWLRYWTYARPKLARSRILLCDRYFYDALTNPGPWGLKHVLDWITIRLSPRPDIVFVLSDSPDAINARKPELSASEIQRQQQQYERLFHCSLRAHRLCVVPDPAVNANQIVSYVLAAFGRRNA